MQKNRRFSVYLAIAAALVLVLSACSSSSNNSTTPAPAAPGTGASANQDPVKIGADIPISGSLADGGANMANALALAEEEINAAGGIKSMGGRKIKVVTCDHQGQPDVAVTCVDRLVQQDKVSVLLGSYTSATGLTASNEAEKLQVPWLQALGNSTEITSRGFKYTFRNKYNSVIIALQTWDMLEQLEKATGHSTKRVALMYEDSAYGSDAGKQTVANLRPGFQIVANVSFKSGTPDLTPQLSKVKDAKPDVIFVADYLPDTIVLLKNMKSLGMTMPLITVGGGGLGKGVVDLGDVSQSLLVLSGYSTDMKTQGNAELAARYKAKFNRDMNDDASATYQALYIIAAALENAKSDDPKKIRDGMVAVNITSGPAMTMPTLHNRIFFGPDGQFPEQTVITVQLQGKEYKSVLPAELAGAKLDSSRWWK